MCGAPEGKAAVARSRAGTTVSPGPEGGAGSRRGAHGSGLVLGAGAVVPTCRHPGGCGAVPKDRSGAPKTTRVSSGPNGTRATASWLSTDVWGPSRASVSSGVPHWLTAETLVRGREKDSRALQSGPGAQVDSGPGLATATGCTAHGTPCYFPSVNNIISKGHKAPRSGISLRNPCF